MGDVGNNSIITWEIGSKFSCCSLPDSHAWERRGARGCRAYPLILVNRPDYSDSLFSPLSNTNDTDCVTDARMPTNHLVCSCQGKKRVEKGRRRERMGGRRESGERGQGGQGRDSPLVNPHPFPGLQPEKRLLLQELERNQVMGRWGQKACP